jgi:hypothetical protein
MKKTVFVIFLSVIALFGNTIVAQTDTDWTSLYTGKDLSGWFVRGKAVWTVRDGVLIGEGGMGHIYTDLTCTDFEVKGTFRITANGNSGFYFRANPPADNPDGFPRGYEAQICNSQDAYTGWLWKPGTPTGKATELLTKDGEWFNYRIKATGNHIQFWINDKPVMAYDDNEYKTGHFAIQGHNPGMKIEAKDLYYRNLDRK